MGEMLSPPSHGGRLQAKLAAARDGVAQYELVLSDASGRWAGAASVAEGNGAVSFGAWQGQGEPPGWLVEGARALLRTGWQRARTGLPWPRRLTRWRPGPEAPA
ncbi:MAG TPA: hypothetical protein VGK73_11800 [Polyangiaceae bacterium]